MLLNAFSLSEHEVSALGINIRALCWSSRSKTRKIDNPRYQIGCYDDNNHRITRNDGQHFFSVFATKFLPARVNGRDISHALSVTCT